MTTSRLTLAARLQLESRQWLQGLSQAQGGTKRFVTAARSEFAQLRGFMGSTTGMLAQLGVGFGAMNTVMRSAQTDKALTQIKQTADLTGAQIDQLRGKLHGMAAETGNTFQSLQDGFGQLVAGGLSFDQALPTIDAINASMRVTGSQATTLAGVLQSAKTNFNFDLTQPGKALELLDKMTVAGRAGVIEIEDLAGVFATAAGNARSAGLDFQETLAIIEGLATATTKDRVGTLVDSTLRLFTNSNYMREAQKATGVRFFDEANARRNPLDILTEIQDRYSKLDTDLARFEFISGAFGKADQDTIKGINQALSEGTIGQIRKIADDVRRAPGTTMRDLPEAMSNSVAQAGVLRETLATVGDQVAMPINKALADGIKHLTGSKAAGGMEMDGWDLLAGGLLTAGGAYVGGRAMKGTLGKLLSKAGASGTSLVSGVVTGNVLQQAGAATPVFVVGAAPGLFSAGAGLPAVIGNTAGGKDTAKKIGVGAVLSGLVGKLTVPAALLSSPLSRYAGTMSAGMDDEKLQSDVGRTLRRGRGAGLMSAMARQAGRSNLEVEVVVKDGRVDARVTNAQGVDRATVSTRARTGRMMDAEQ